MAKCIECGATEGVFNHRCKPCREKRDKEVASRSSAAYFIQPKQPYTIDFHECAKIQIDCWNDLIEMSQWSTDEDIQKYSADPKKRHEEWDTYYTQLDAYKAYEAQVKENEEKGTEITLEKVDRPKKPYKNLGTSAIPLWRAKYKNIISTDMLHLFESHFRIAVKNFFAAIEERKRASWPGKRDHDNPVYYFTKHISSSKCGTVQEKAEKLGCTLPNLIRNGCVNLPENYHPKYSNQGELTLGGQTYLVKFHQELPIARITDITVRMELNSNKGSVSFKYQQNRPPVDFGGYHAIGDINWRRTKIREDKTINGKLIKKGTEGCEYLDVMILETGEIIHYDRPVDIPADNFCSRNGERITVQSLSELDKSISEAEKQKDWNLHRELSEKKARWSTRLSRSNEAFCRNIAADLWKKRGVRHLFLENLDVKKMIERGNKNPTLKASQKHRQQTAPPGLLIKTLDELFNRGYNSPDDKSWERSAPRSRGTVEFIENYRGSSSRCFLHNSLVVGDKSQKILSYECGCRRDRTTNALYALALRAESEFSQTYPTLTPLVDLLLKEYVKNSEVCVKKELIKAVA